MGPTCKPDNCKCFCHVNGEPQGDCCGREHPVRQAMRVIMNHETSSPKGTVKYPGIPEEIPIEEVSSVLLEAHEIVSKRNDAYGEPTDTAERVSKAFSYLTKRSITPADVALIQMLFKIVRSEHGYKRDNNVDLAGYTDIRERCLLKEKNRKNG